MGEEEVEPIAVQFYCSSQFRIAKIDELHPGRCPVINLYKWLIHEIVDSWENMRLKDDSRT